MAIPFVKANLTMMISRFGYFKVIDIGINYKVILKSVIKLNPSDTS